MKRTRWKDVRVIVHLSDRRARRLMFDMPISTMLRLSQIRAACDRGGEFVSAELPGDLRISVLVVKP